MTIRTGYLVMKQSWEYNDEIYHQPQSGGGIPRRVFFSKNRALKEANRLTAIQLLEMGNIHLLKEYTHEGASTLFNFNRIKELVEVLELDNIDELDNKELMELVENWFDSTENLLPKILSMEKASEIARCLDIEFYTVVKVDVEIED